MPELSFPYQPCIAPLVSCQFCGWYHHGVCIRVKAIEYYDNGQIKRVEFHDIFKMAPQEYAA
jgi:hypothetical protein